MDWHIHRLPEYRKHLPLPLRRAAGRLKRVVVPNPDWSSPEFRQRFRLLQSMQYAPREAVEAYQLERLKALVHHAYHHVPYYRRVWDRHRVKPDDVQSLADLQKLPILTKQEVRDHPDELVADNFPPDRIMTVGTSGTSGDPLRTYQDSRTKDPLEDAHRLFQWRSAGYRFGDPIVLLRDRVIDLPRRWDYDSDLNALVLTGGDLTEERMREYLRVMRAFRPRFLWAYPSAAEILAAFALRAAPGETRLKAAFLESERVFPFQRELIRSAFGAPVFAGYGQTERVVDAVECEAHRGYHVDPVYGIMELIDDGFRPIAEPGAVGRVVGTGFDSFAMPFIRYMANDLASWAGRDCSCGRRSPLVEDFHGRPREQIVSKTGQLLPLIALYTGDGHLDLRLQIREMRFVQERPGEVIVLLVVPGPAPAEEVRSRFQQQIERRLDPSQFDVRVVLVDEIPVGGRGKRGLLDQRLPLDSSDLPASARPAHAPGGAGPRAR